MKRIWAFLPFLLVGATHLVGLFAGVSPLSSATKALLMPALLLAVLLCLPLRRVAVVVPTALAIGFSWGGDILIASPSDAAFLFGLGFFFLAHTAYLVLFLGPLRVQPMPGTVGVLVVWWGALLLILQPSIGGLLVPLGAYGFILAASTAASFGTTRTIAAGALLFLASDTLLALKLFLPAFSLWESDFIIMLLYVAGQGLIGLGIVQRAAAMATRSEVAPVE